MEAKKMQIITGKFISPEQVKEGMLVACPFDEVGIVLGIRNVAYLTWIKVKIVRATLSDLNAEEEFKMDQLGYIWSLTV